MIVGSLQSSLAGQFYPAHKNGSNSCRLQRYECLEFLSSIVCIFRVPLISHAFTIHHATKRTCVVCGRCPNKRFPCAAFWCCRIENCVNCVLDVVHTQFSFFFCNFEHLILNIFLRDSRELIRFIKQRYVPASSSNFGKKCEIIFV